MAGLPGLENKLDEIERNVKEEVAKVQKSVGKARNKVDEF